MSAVQRSVDLKPYNSWKVGGSAEYFVSPDNLNDLIDALTWAKDNNHCITILGDGTNVLISDAGIKGLVVCLNQWNKIEFSEVKQGRLELVAQAGTSKVDLMRTFLKHKLAPALFLSGLPGNLAGGIVMNAGVREDRTPREFCEIVDWFEVLTLDENFPALKRFTKNEIKWIYRNTEGWQPGVIVRAQLSWQDDPIEGLAKQVMAANKLRLSKQPLDLPSCGSTFKNSEAGSAGKLIDQCGLKGFNIGGAEVSKKHANFIVNTSEALASEIDQVIKTVQQEVLKQKGVRLTTEVKYLGPW